MKRMARARPNRRPDHGPQACPRGRRRDGRWFCLLACCLLLPGLGQGQEFRTAAPPGTLECAPLRLSSLRGEWPRPLLPWLDELAPDLPLEDWGPGLTIAQQTGPLVSYDDALDHAAQYRVSPDYCPDYWPEHEPGQILGKVCTDTLLTSEDVLQGLDTNPFRVAKTQWEELNSSAAARERRLLWLLGYAWVHRGYGDTPEGLADGLLSAEERLRDDVVASVILPPLVAKIPPALTEVKPGEGEMAVDMRVTLGFSYDSVAQFEETLLRGAGRGLGGLVVAGRGQLGDGVQAQRTAARLQRQGRLPANFRVIVGEYIQARGGTVVGVFLRDRVLEGQTLAATLEDIHDQGGLAYMARPGDIGAPALLRALPFDGFLYQVGNFELFRTLQLLDDPHYADKPGLYASSSVYAAGVGLPYTNVTLDTRAPDPLYGGLAARQGYAAGALYLPWMMFLLTKPIAVYQKTLNEYFATSDRVALRLRKWLRADGVILRTSWDDGMRDLISLAKAWPAAQQVLRGGSPLRRAPQLNYIEAEYGPVAFGYDGVRHEWVLSARERW